MTVLAGICAAVLAAVHVAAGHLRFLTVIPRSRWLSAGGGVSVAYVFVHILPDLAEHQETLAETIDGGLAGFLEHHAYLLALVGLAAFYGLERLAMVSRRSAIDDRVERAHPAPGEAPTPAGVFWIHMASYALYNGLIGYLLVHRDMPGRASLLLFAAAMATHFVVNDSGLRHAHRHRYDRVGRWILAAAVAGGFAIGVATPIGEAVLAALFGFLAGGIVLNVLKEELPEERESNFPAFAVGTLGYAVLLLTIG